MKFKQVLSKMVITCMLVSAALFSADSMQVMAAEAFDASFYATTYPDVVAVYGTAPEALYSHYLEHGQKEGRLPNAAAQGGADADAPSPDQAVVIQDTGIVALKDIPSLSTIRKKCTDEEMQQAYNVALNIVTPLVGKSQEEQLVGVASQLRSIFENGGEYSMSNAHYNDPYGYLVAGTASCAGCTRTTILCLEMLGFTSVEHVHPNQYCHQWARVKMADGAYAICDAFGLYCGLEPAPYVHPYAQ